MNKLFVFGILLFLSCSLFGQGIANEALDSLYYYVEKTHSEAIIIQQNGKLIGEKYFGIGHPDTLIEAMSCTKSIVGLAAVCLLDDGFLDSLDTPVYHYYPEWKQGKKQLITLRHLLNMTSGMQNVPNTGVEIYPSPDFVQLALAAELSDDPGKRFSYNNKSLNLMAGIFRQATGKM